MTANQVYKLSGSKTPFSSWVGEQKTKYGKNFVENEEFLNANGSFGSPQSEDQVPYPSGAGINTQVSLGSSTAQAGFNVKNIMPVVVLIGAVVVAGWAYNRYIK
jgi:hypothetical protein